ncbi:MAG: PDZ domain-containing protein [Pirellulales bacterium]|nr:PDZ domain-containing protein [Pirellulales bacterium]
MRPRVLPSRVFARFAILAILPFLLAWTAAWAAAQESPVDPAEIGELLRQGRRLEVENRWDEALAHYEKAIRRFPGQASLERRFDFSRMHYDVRRRYADASFAETMDGLALPAALDLYDEVLLKIQSHYVEAPHWKELVEQGANTLDIALVEDAFLRRNVAADKLGAVGAFRQALRREIGERVIRTREDAREAVRAAGDLGQRVLGLAPVAAVFEFACGAANSLDVYSAYLTADQLNEIYSQIEGNFVGLGIELKLEDGRLVILRVIPGSPAEEVGIHPRDEILAVDGRTVSETSTAEAANLLQGESGSFVELSLAARGEAPRLLRVQRRRVDVPSVDGVRMIDTQQGIGYLRLTCFQKTTCRDLDDALWRLNREGMRGGLIMDLRGNPGGLLVSAVEVVDKFLDHGVIVSTRGRSLQEIFTYSAHAAGTWRMPLVVLIDQESASAAEIFAGAIQDHRRGTLVGQQSYGKGSVQGIFPLHASLAGMRLTTAKFYSPNSRPYSVVGVKPDIEVHQAARPVNGAIDPAGEDPVLAAALQIARQTAVRPATTPR